MRKSRRDFLKVAGLSACGLAAAFGLPYAAKAAAPSYEVTPKELKAKQWGMVIYTSKFETPESFQVVIDACHKAHNVPFIPSKEDPTKGSRQEVKWIWHDSYERTFADEAGSHVADAVRERQYLLLCNHCENPPCVRVCPTGATFKRSDGIVVMDYHRCIGCRFCMAGCPYGARSFNFHNPRPYIAQINDHFPTRMRGVVEKCTFCSERLAEGLMPLCVEASNGAIIFGDLSDPESEVSKVLRENFSIQRKVSIGTNPSVHYIL